MDAFRRDDSVAPLSSVAVPTPVPAGRGAREPIPRLQTILVTTDFSELGNRAIPYALSVVPEGGTVILLHVRPLFEPERTPNPLIAHYVPHPAPAHRECEQVRKEIADRLWALISVEAAKRPVELRVEVADGCSVAAAICAAAERSQVDAICMATHGRSGVFRLLLGSVAESVLRVTERMVILIRPPTGHAGRRDAE